MLLPLLIGIGVIAAIKKASSKKAAPITLNPALPVAKQLPPVKVDKTVPALKQPAVVQRVVQIAKTAGAVEVAKLAGAVQKAGDKAGAKALLQVAKKKAKLQLAIKISGSPEPFIDSYSGYLMDAGGRPIVRTLNHDGIFLVVNDLGEVFRLHTASRGRKTLVQVQQNNPVIRKVFAAARRQATSRDYHGRAPIEMRY